MTGHTFLSYSHTSDGKYVELLAKHLNQQGVAVWFDQDIITGDRWMSVIRAQIDSCKAFVVVMSPASEESEWVNREINRAEQMGKPIYPLLLKGTSFFRLSDVQYEDVTGSRMPPVKFVDRLRGNQLVAHDSTKALPDAATLERQHKEAQAMFKLDRTASIQLTRRVLADRTLVLGADHPDTLSTKHLLTYNLGHSGEPRNRAEAVAMASELVDDLTRALGPHHLETIHARSMLAMYLGEPRYAEVFRFYGRLVRGMFK